MKTAMICLGAGLLMTGCVAFPVDEHRSGGYAGTYHGSQSTSRPYYDYDPRYSYDPRYDDPRYQDGVRYKRARGGDTHHRPYRLPSGQIYSPSKPVHSHTSPQYSRPTSPKNHQQRPYTPSQRIHATQAASPSISTPAVVGKPVLNNQFGQARVKIDSKKYSKKAEEKRKSAHRRDKQDD